jgi:hypothetical protein
LVGKFDESTLIDRDNCSGTRFDEDAQALLGRRSQPATSQNLRNEQTGTELRRRKIGQHTIEKAVHGRVCMSTYKKIVAAIVQYKREKLSAKIA